MRRHVNSRRLGTVYPGYKLSVELGLTMSEHRRSTALAIKRCLEHLVIDAQRSDMGELVQLLGMASLAAEDAAQAAAETAPPVYQELLRGSPQGHC